MKLNLQFYNHDQFIKNKLKNKNNAMVFFHRLWQINGVQKLQIGLLHQSSTIFLDRNIWKLQINIH